MSGALGFREHKNAFRTAADQQRAILLVLSAFRVLDEHYPGWNTPDGPEPKWQAVWSLVSEQWTREGTPCSAATVRRAWKAVGSNYAGRVFKTYVRF